MVWRHNLRPQQIETLRYFDKFDYPLTKKELQYWLHTTLAPGTPSYVGGGQGVVYKDSYYFFKNRNYLVKLRQQREKYSLLKWGRAYEYAAKLAKLPFVLAIFITGSLAMNNCKKSDDIDFMVVTCPDTLWIARLISLLMFWNTRRLPGQKIAPDKVCLNLWLDIKNLKLKKSISLIKNLYVAHEILQAKCIFDRGGIQYQFLKQNVWVRGYLPNAYRLSLNNLKFKIYNLNSNLKFKILNYILFVLQYLYMKPKMTTEKVGLGFAFFHPKS